MSTFYKLTTRIAPTVLLLVSALTASIVQAKERSPEDEKLLKVLQDKAFRNSDRALYGKQKDRSRAFFSDELNNWVTLYLNGDMVASQKIWANILKNIGTNSDIKWFLDRVAQRIEIDTCDTDHQIAPVKLLQDLHEQTVKSVGANHPFVAYTYDSLSNYYEGIKDYKTCEPYRIKALEIRKKNYGPRDDKISKSYALLGRHYYECGNYKKAQDCLNKALAMSPGHDEATKYLKWTNTKLRSMVNAQSQQQPQSKAQPKSQSQSKSQSHSK